MSFKTYTLIKSPKGLQIGNIIFADTTVIPANFILATPTWVGDVSSKAFNADTNNCAYLNIEAKWLTGLLKMTDNAGLFEKGEFTAHNIFATDNCTNADGLPEWMIQYGNFDKNKLVHYIHEIQNAYREWTGEDMIPLSAELEDARKLAEANQPEDEKYDFPIYRKKPDAKEWYRFGSKSYLVSVSKGGMSAKVDSIGIAPEVEEHIFYRIMNDRFYESATAEEFNVVFDDVIKQINEAKK